MGVHSAKLHYLMSLLYSKGEAATILEIACAPFSFQTLASFDSTMPGPSLAVIQDNRNSGHYDISERDIFRPLQYCLMWFPNLERTYAKPEDEEEIDLGDYTTRFLVLMSSVHIEALVKRIAGEGRSPLGLALQNWRAKKRIPPLTWDIARQFTAIYNDAKHEMSHPKDTHLFSRKDAVLAYFICRKLGLKLYPLLKLKSSVARISA